MQLLRGPAAVQVPFEQVPDLVASRRVLLKAGWAFVSRHEVASLVVSRFRAGLSHNLVLTARRWATLIADEEADRLTPLISTLNERQVCSFLPWAAHMADRRLIVCVSRHEVAYLLVSSCTAGLSHALVLTVQ